MEIKGPAGESAKIETKEQGRAYACWLPALMDSFRIKARHLPSILWELWDCAGLEEDPMSLDRTHSLDVKKGRIWRHIQSVGVDSLGFSIVCTEKAPVFVGENNFSLGLVGYCF